jgi:hypothetical protein
MAALVPDLPQVEQHIVAMTNQVRAEHKLAPLKLNAMLAKAARAFAEKVATSGNFSHSADGRTPGQRAEAAGYKACDVAENLAMDQDQQGFDTGALALQAIAGWMNSPPHRANILRASVSEFGVGVARAPGPKPKFISVELFAAPASKSLTFKIKNSANVTLSYSLGGPFSEIRPGVTATHSSCTPKTLVILQRGDLISGSHEIARVIAENNKNYVVRSDSGGAPRLEIVARSKKD